MTIKSNYLIIMAFFLITLCSVVIFNYYDTLNTDLKENNNIMDDNTGCCSVILNVGPGHDVISYRRDSNYTADMNIQETDFAGQNAVKQYKTDRGYFSHVIITENGWIIGIGGRDNSDNAKMLEKLASNIISKNNIQQSDIDKAHALIKSNGWGHFIIISPQDDVGATAYDYRVKENFTEIFKLKTGDYIKIPNNPRYVDYGQYNTINNDPVTAAILINGNDVYGQDRKDITTYEYTNNNITSIVNVWASFDGGALLTGIKGKPDSIQFMGNFTNGNQLPIIPSKKFLGQIRLSNSNLPSKENMASILNYNFLEFIKIIDN
jgi:hypothetical protein